MEKKKIKSAVDDFFKSSKKENKETDIPFLNEYPFSAAENLPICDDLEKKILEEDGSNEQDNDPFEEPPLKIAAKENMEKTDELSPNVTGIEENASVANDNPDSEDLSKEKKGQEPEKITPVSLLNNLPFIKLVEECSGIMDEFESYTARLQTDEGRMITELVIRRMQELLERCGVSRIDKEVEFSILRHIPMPMELVAEGAAIENTVEPGLAIEKRVIRKAKVIISKNK